MKYLILSLLLLTGCASQQEAADQQHSQLAAYCYNRAQAMYSHQMLRNLMLQEFASCMNRMGLQ